MNKCKTIVFNILQIILAVMGYALFMIMLVIYCNNNEEIAISTKSIVKNTVILGVFFGFLHLCNVAVSILAAVMRKRAFGMICAGVTVLSFSSTFLLSFWMPVTDKPYETVLDNPIFVTFMLLQGVAGLALGIIRFVKRV